MAYVPPALRKKQASEADRKGIDNATPLAEAIAATTVEPAQKTLLRCVDIYNHYWAPNERLDEDQMPFPIAEPMQTSTLNASADEPDKLRYILLFRGSNPRWSNEKIIFVKSHLRLLPGGEKLDGQAGKTRDAHNDTAALAKDKEGHPATAKGAPAVTATTTQKETTSETIGMPDGSLCDLDPIAVFEQVGSHKGRFEFAGYHQIARLAYLEPHSDELQRTLQQKFSRVDSHGNVIQKQRSREAWFASMCHRWAVIKLQKMENAGIPDPEIQVGAEESREPTKSVNELLREMRGNC